MPRSRRRALTFPIVSASSIAVLAALAVGACGVSGDDRALPIFEGGLGVSTSEAGLGDGGGNDASQPTDSGSGDANFDDAGFDGSIPPTDGGVPTDLVISQVQSRGNHGGNDEFVEIYNPTAGDITFDNTWSVKVRNATGGAATCATALTSTLLTGGGQVVPSHKHVLFATSSYSETTTADATFGAGIPDAASLVLVHAGAAVDALCFSYSTDTTNALTSCLTAYVCEGAPATNPHDNTSGTNANASLERKPGGAAGNTQDTNVNANDFQGNATPDPHDIASAATP